MCKDRYHIQEDILVMFSSSPGDRYMARPQGNGFKCRYGNNWDLQAWKCIPSVSYLSVITISTYRCFSLPVGLFVFSLFVISLKNYIIFYFILSQH